MNLGEQEDVSFRRQSIPGGSETRVPKAKPGRKSTKVTICIATCLKAKSPETYLSTKPASAWRPCNSEAILDITIPMYELKEARRWSG